MRKFLPLLIISLFLAELSYADNVIKELIFEDCNKAEQELIKLNAEERKLIVPFFAKVLKIQLPITSQDFSAKQTPSSGLTAAVDNAHNVNIWKMIDSNREQEAKGCVLRLLEKIPDEANAIILNLILFSQQESVSSELKEQAESLVWKIAARSKAAANSNSISELISPLIAGLSQDNNSFFIANILMEFVDQSFPLLVEQLKTTDLNKREVIYALLEREVSRVRAIDVLNPLFDSTDEDLKNKAVNLLLIAQSKNPLISETLLNLYAGFSISQREIYFKGMKQFLSEQQNNFDPKISKEEASTVFKELIKPPANLELLSLIFTAMLKKHPERALDILDNYVFSSQNLIAPTESDLRVIELLAYYPSSNTEIKKIFFAAGYSDSIAARTAAIYALGQQSFDAEDKLLLYLKILKKIFAENDLYKKEQIIFAVAQSVLRFPVSSLSLKRLEPYFIEALSLPGNFYGDNSGRSLNYEQALIVYFNYLGSDIVANCVKNIKKFNTIGKLRVLRLFKDKILADLQLIRSVILLLEDPSQEVRESVVDLLGQASSRIIVDIKNSLKKSAEKNKNSYLEVLLKLNAKETTVNKHYQELFPSLSCERKIYLLPDLLKNQTQNKTILEKEIINCLLLANKQFSELKIFGSLSNESKQEIIKIIKEGKLGEDLLRNFFDSYLSLGFEEQELTPICVEIFFNKETALKKVTLDFLFSKQKLANDLKHNILEIYQNSKQDSLLRTKAALLLVHYEKETNEEVEKYLAKEMSGPKYQWVLNVLMEMKSEKVISIIIKVLQESSGERKILLLQFLGNYGVKADSAIRILLYYIKDRNDLVSYQATVALMKLAPENEDLLPALRKQMLSRYGLQLLEEDLPKSSLKNTLEKLRSTSNKAVENEIIEKLIS